MDETQQTPQEIKKTVFDCVANMDLEDEDIPIAQIMLCTAVVGPNGDRVAKTLEIPRTLARHWMREMREKGIVEGHIVYAGEWMKKKTGDIAFFLDVAILRGWIVRVPDTT